MGAPRLTIAVALLLLVALAATMTYTGFLVVGVLAEYAGTSRFVAGLLLGALFARFPWVSKGRPRIVGIMPKPLRRPLMVTLLVLCLLRFLMQGETVPAVVLGFTTAFVLGFPLLKHALFARMSSFAGGLSGGLSGGFPGGFSGGRNTAVDADNTVIEGEFRERKE